MKGYSDSALLLLDRRVTSKPERRLLLPDFDVGTIDPDTGAPLPVTTMLNGVIPSWFDPHFHRANVWGVTMPGLPVILGGASGAAQERVLTYLLDRYPPGWQDRSLDAYAARGYRHWWLSVPDSRDGPSRLTIDAYCDLTKRVLDAGLWPCHFLRSKDYDGRNPSPTGVYPWIEALLTFNDSIAMIAHAWEASLMYDPTAFRATVDRDAISYPDLTWAIHLQQGYAHYGPNEPGPGKLFWDANLAVGVKTLLYQYRTEPAWSAGMMQARGNDVSVRLVQHGLWNLPQTVDWIAFEVVAQLQFNNRHDGDGRLADEDAGDLKGYECLCTPGPMPLSGFGNGARYPDGNVI